MQHSTYWHKVIMPTRRAKWHRHAVYLTIMMLGLSSLILSIPSVIAFDRQTYFPQELTREIDLDPYEATPNRPQEWKITQIYTDDIGREYVLIGKRECEELVWLKEKYRCERGSYKVFLSDFHLLGI